MPDGRKASPRAGRARRPEAARPALDSGTEVVGGSGCAEDVTMQGVVIPFTDITIRKHDPKPLGAAKRDAELANGATGRILADASHDLRQPLQALALLQALLATGAEGTASERLVAKLANTIATMSRIVDKLQLRADENCEYVGKPAKPVELARLSQDLLAPSKRPAIDAAPAAWRSGAGPEREAGQQPVQRAGRGRDVISLIDDDGNLRDAVRLVLERDGRTVEAFADAETFLAAYSPATGGCLLIDAYLPGIGGLELLQRLRSAADPVPAIMITGSSDVRMAVRAMKAGAADFIEKPIAAADLLASIDDALGRAQDSSKQIAWQISAAEHLAGLTPRQFQVMDLVLAGHPSKNIAADLGISQRTVESHRASIMKRTGTRSLPALVRLVLAVSAAAP